jgi:long-chain acyl-CoA synthetase
MKGKEAMPPLTTQPWKALDGFRGRVFDGVWPSIPAIFAITAMRFPDRPCFSVYDPDRFSLTYREASDAVKRTAAYLRSKGLSKGDRVGLTGKNSPEWAVAYIAVLSAGAIVVPIDHQLKVSEVQYLLERAQAGFLFVDDEKYGRIHVPGGEARVVSLTKGIGTYIFDIESEGGELPALPSASDEAAILFTSGTMGVAKGVVLTHANFSSDCYLVQEYIELFPEDIFYVFLPIHHSYTMLAVFIVALSVGSELVFAKKLSVQKMLSDLKEAKITMFLGIPLIFNKMAKTILKGIREKGFIVYALIRGLMFMNGVLKKHLGLNPGLGLFAFIRKKASMDSLRICISGGGPLPASTFKRFNELGINFIQGYGLTEAAPIVTLNPTYRYTERSVGKVLAEMDVRIGDPDPNGIGEVLVKGPNVMAGYYQDKEATASAFTEDGYLKTGDVGYLDRENYLYLTGRAKSLIVTEGGKNVYPEEIEAGFEPFEEVEQVLVRGYLKDQKMKTEDIEALIYPNKVFFAERTAGMSEAERASLLSARIDEIVLAVNRQLLPYQKISRVKVLSEAMEMTTTKKIKRATVGL